MRLQWTFLAAGILGMGCLPRMAYAEYALYNIGDSCVFTNPLTDPYATSGTDNFTASDTRIGDAPFIDACCLIGGIKRHPATRTDQEIWTVDSGGFDVDAGFKTITVSYKDEKTSKTTTVTNTATYPGETVPQGYKEFTGFSKWKHTEKEVIGVIPLVCDGVWTISGDYNRDDPQTETRELSFYYYLGESYGRVKCTKLK